PLPNIPPGSYETIVIAGTGQTWQVPNDIDRVLMGGPDPTQSCPGNTPSACALYVQMLPGETPPSGSISGTLHAARDVLGDAYVFAFRAEAPPPPVGTGSPAGSALVPRSAFSAGGEATFIVKALKGGSYLLRALIDPGRRFSPLYPLL